jgi:hypothetical protein
MSFEIPDIAELRGISPEEMRLEMACGLYVRVYTEDMFDEDIRALHLLFP